MLIDSFNRKITYLRVSVTDKCNLGCIYCNPLNNRNKSKILSYEELLFIIKCLVKSGIEKVRVTGGEPLLRKNIGFFIEELGKIQGIKEIHLTTNGILIDKYLNFLVKSKVDRLNISVDSFCKEIYQNITGSFFSDRLIQNIEKILQTRFKNNLKLNVVVLKKYIEKDLAYFIDFIRQNNVNIRFIELMPSKENNHRDLFLSSADLKKIIEKHYKLEYNMTDNFISKKYNVIEKSTNRKLKGNFSFIEPVSHPFCNKCNRIRLTSTGELKLCLVDKGYDLTEKLSLQENDFIKIIKELIIKKPQSHYGFKNKIKSMNTIGG